MEQEQMTMSLVDNGPYKDAYKVIPLSFPKMTGYIQRFYLNACHNIVELDVSETKDFAVLDWIGGMPKEEILTFMSLDANGKILCMLRFLGLTLLDHETVFEESESRQTVKHAVHLKYETMERIENAPIIGGK